MLPSPLYIAAIDDTRLMAFFQDSLGKLAPER